MLPTSEKTARLDQFIQQSEVVMPLSKKLPEHFLQFFPTSGRAVVYTHAGEATAVLPMAANCIQITADAAAEMLESEHMIAVLERRGYTVVRT